MRIINVFNWGTLGLSPCSCSFTGSHLIIDNVIFISLTEQLGLNFKSQKSQGGVVATKYQLTGPSSVHLFKDFK